MRDARNRLKNWTGTVHFASATGGLACGPVRTHDSYLRPTIEDVTCQRCIAMCGADEVTGATDPAPVQEHVARRAAERAARQAARQH